MAADSLKERFLQRLDRALTASRTRANKKRLATQATFDATVNFAPEALIQNFSERSGAISIGSHSMIKGEMLTYRHGGQIKLGSYVFLGPGSKIWSAASITIGDYVLISHNVDIHDNDSHSVQRSIRREHTRFILDTGALPTTAYGAADAPVEIEDDAWIGANVTILKGVHIGRGAVIGSGSVVTRNVEAFTLVAGNPAVLIRKLDQE
jgi:acetyltransferase-like isoleucine patch superfamily enzyme